MVVQKVTRVANRGKVIHPRRRPTKRAAAKRVSAGNPAHMLTLGFVNPHKKRSTTPVAAKARRKAKRSSSNRRRAASNRRRRPAASNHRRRSRPVASNRKRRNATRIVVIGPRKNKRRNGARRGRRNPTFFGSSVNAVKMAEYIFGGLIGVTINKTVLPMLPASLISSNIATTIAALVIAGVEWWLASMIDKDFGSAVGFGAFMNAGSQALNAFVPSVGSVVGLSGRGMADFVPGRFVVPQNPVTDAMSGISAPGGLMTGAYPVAYGRAA
jgi:hypothetical protein